MLEHDWNLVTNLPRNILPFRPRSKCIRLVRRFLEGGRQEGH